MQYVAEVLLQRQVLRALSRATRRALISGENHGEIFLCAVKERSGALASRV